MSVFKFIRDREGYEGCLTSVKYECEGIAGKKPIEAILPYSKDLEIR